MPASPLLAFDIESIPDIAGLRTLRQSEPGLDDAAVYAGEIAARQELGKSDFMPLHLQRVLVISCVFRNAEGLRVHSFVDRDNASEGKVIQTFFNTLEKHVPQLVSWNGGGFDLPVLHYRALRHRVAAPRYWEVGDEDTAFRGRVKAWMNALWSDKDAQADDTVLAVKRAPGEHPDGDAPVYTHLGHQFLPGQLGGYRRIAPRNDLHSYAWQAHTHDKHVTHAC